MQPSCRMFVVAFEGAILGWDGIEVDGGAKVVLAGTTVVASGLETGDSGFDSDTVTRSDVVDSFTDGNDDTTGFMTKSALVFDLPGSKTSVFPEVDVGTTDTGGTDMDEGHTGARGGGSGFDQLELFLVGSPARRGEGESRGEMSVHDDV